MQTIKDQLCFTLLLFSFVGSVWGICPFIRPRHLLSGRSTSRVYTVLRNKFGLSIAKVSPLTSSCHRIAFLLFSSRSILKVSRIQGIDQEQRAKKLEKFTKFIVGVETKIHIGIRSGTTAKPQTRLRSICRLPAYPVLAVHVIIRQRRIPILLKVNQMTLSA